MVVPLCGDADYEENPYQPLHKLHVHFISHALSISFSILGVISSNPEEMSSMFSDLIGRSRRRLAAYWRTVGGLFKELYGISRAEV